MLTWVMVGLCLPKCTHLVYMYMAFLYAANIAHSNSNVDFVILIYLSFLFGGGGGRGALVAGRIRKKNGEGEL